MFDTPESLQLMAGARIALLMQLMRMLFRDRAERHNQTSDDILRWSEEVKQFFETRMGNAKADAYMTSVIDDFFNMLAAEVRQDRENL